MNNVPAIFSRHPSYMDEWTDFEKFRLAYKGGRNFIERYMAKFSSKESDDDFENRKLLAYCPRFAASVINDIKNGIYQRTVDVTREGGSESYQQACRGLVGGVDLALSTMNSFIGTRVLEELLIIRRVGILVDNHNNLGVTVKDKGNKHPYLGLYTGEAILNWQYETLESERVLKAVLLEETVDTLDDWGLPRSANVRYRLMERSDDGVTVTFFDSVGKIIDGVFLSLTRIPFTIIETPVSLMQDVADYQIALMNLENSDISFARVANFPLFYEWFDPKAEHTFKKPAGVGVTGEVSDQVKSQTVQTEMGLTKGRRYPITVSQAPGFINPDPNTLRVSMEKGQQLRADIRLLVNLNLSNIHPSRSSAESKGIDKEGLESSLSYIGLMLQKAENEIAYHWSAFEGGKSAKITYPRSYNLKTDDERFEEADKIGKLMHKVPSNTFKKELARKLAHILVATDVTNETWDKIVAEINAAKSLTTDPDEILADVKEMLVSHELASELRGYPSGEATKAFDEKQKLIEFTIATQGAADEARGGADGLGKSSSEEKMGKEKRGTADKVVKDG